MTPVLNRLLALALAVVLVFFALRLIPGDAISAAFAESDASSAYLTEQRARLGLDQPLPVQFARYVGALLRGDLGVSLSRSVPVSELISAALPPTLALAAAAFPLAAASGLALGLAAASGGIVTHAARLAMTLALSVPVYWTGTLALMAFGTGDALPVLVLAFHTSGAVARVVLASAQAAQRSGYVRMARAKGLRERQIVARHVLPVILPPALSVMALQAGFLLSGTVIIESLFLRPGMGRLLLDAVWRRDYPVVQGVVIVGVLAYLLVNTAADLLRRLADPRLRVT